MTQSLHKDDREVADFLSRLALVYKALTAFPPAEAHGANPHRTIRGNISPNCSPDGRPYFRGGYLSSPFLLGHADIKSATCRLFKSEKGKCVLPLMPTSGKWTTVTSPPRLLTASRHFRAISRRARAIHPAPDSPMVPS